MSTTVRQLYSIFKGTAFTVTSVGVKNIPSAREIIETSAQEQHLDNCPI